MLSVRRELFSHLSDVFEPLGEELMQRADTHLDATLEHWLTALGKGRGDGAHWE